MQICYRCHQYHDDKDDICHFCKIDSLIDAEVPEELQEECDAYFRSTSTERTATSELS